MDLLHLTAAELGRKIKNREVAVTEAEIGRAHV